MTMTKRPSIASVTVVYNGAAHLPRQLHALKRQTRALDEMIMVDNASSDDSVRLVEADFPEVTILNQPKNIGVGGGFSVGLDYSATQRKHDWIWLLDQDSLPADDSLEQLLKAVDSLGDQADSVAILAPTCTNEKTNLNYSGLVWRYGLRNAPVSARHNPISFVDSVISSGTLLRREAIEKVGLPRSDFFMDFVDHEYCLRLRRHGYKIAVVRASRFEHAIGDPRTVRVLGFEKIWSNHVPWREYYMTRNAIFTVWKYDPDWRTKCVVAHRLLCRAAAILLFGEDKLACLAMMYRGFADGCTGKLGIRSFDGKESSSPV
ncbi:MAG: glycosyltransferase family 2 protein [Candidatus Sulfotelmatobacter sp.]